VEMLLYGYIFSTRPCDVQPCAHAINRAMMVKADAVLRVSIGSP
jgi:hypothetical protein